MQTQVHSTIHNTSRLVTLNHPNSFDVVCFKKIYLTESGENEINGIQILGGEDSEEVDFEMLGYGKLLFVENWQSSKVIADGINANDMRIKVIALIEPLSDKVFELDKGDLVYIDLSESYGLAYEVVGIENPIGLPTVLNAKRYLLNKRDDLDYKALPQE